MRTERTFSEVLRTFRVRRGFSQEELAERSRLSGETIGAMERGRRKRPYAETIDRLADALGLDASDRLILRDAARAYMRSRARPIEVGSPLPQFDATLIGRDRACAELLALLDERRYVVLAGAAWVGKSCLALEAAKRWSARRGRAIFVELAGIGEEGDLVAAVASAARVGGTDARAIARELEGEPTLLLLDRSGHVASASARFAETMVAETENVRVLATTRFVVPGHGEIVYRLEPLAPDDARALFAERARSADTRFALLPQNLADAEAICERLDGLPYAIELAAASLPALGITGLRERLDGDMSLLDDAHVAARTHRGETLSRALDWTNELLGEEERRLFAHLSVFPGTWSLDAMETICVRQGDEGMAALSSLIDASLVTVEFSGGRNRHRLLHTTRAYALHNLEGRGELAELRSRHARYFESFCRDYENRWWDTPSDAWMAQVLLELDNVRAMLQWAIGENRDLNAGARALVGIVHVQRSGFGGVDFSGFVRKLLLHERELDPFARGCANLLRNFPIPATAAQAHEAVSFWSERGDVRRRYTATWCQYYYDSHYGDLAAAREDARSMTVLAEVMDSDKARAIAAMLSADAETRRGDSTRARDAALDALRLARGCGDDVILGYGLKVLADAAFYLGDPDLALERAREGHAHLPRIFYDGNVRYLNHVAYLILMDRLDEAREELKDVAERLRGDANLRAERATAIDYLSVVEARTGRAEDAARLSGFANAALAEARVRRGPLQQEAYEIAQSILDGSISSERALLEAEGAAMTFEAALLVAGLAGDGVERPGSKRVYRPG